MGVTDHNRGLFAFAVATAAVALVLILAGGFVTTTATGDTIPTWPLAWGRLIPPSFQGGIVVEWSHRVIAGVVALMVLTLAVWSRRRLASVALAGVLVQAAIGGVRIYLPKAAVAIVHACFAQVVFCALVALALTLSRTWREAAPDEDAARARRLGLVTVALIFLQLVAGAVTRHTGAGLAVHLVGALIVLLHVSVFASRLAATSLKRLGLGLMALIAVQLVLGLSAWSFRGTYVRSHEANPAIILTVSAHVAIGALMMAMTLVATLRCFRFRVAEPRLAAVTA